MENSSGQKINKRNTMHNENAFDESGYASFHGSRNTTLESFSSSLIFDPNSENSINLPNTSHLRHSITPFSHNKFSALKNESSHRQQCAVAPAFNETGNCTLDDDNLTTPLSLGSQIRNPSKRHGHSNHRRQHQSSSKKSKKNLFPETKVFGRTHYFNGVERLDIIGMLETLPILDNILNEIDTRSLESMTHVSRGWQQIIYNNKSSLKRLHLYQMNLRFTKENINVRTAKKFRSSSNTNTTVPFKDSNSATFPGRRRGHILPNNENEDVAAKLLMDGKRVRCPRCGRSSKVLKTQKPTVNHATFVTRTIPSPALSNNDKRAQFSRVFSFDSIQVSRSSTPPLGDNDASYGECTGVVCNFKFCLHCSCEFHPGKKCPVTELGTPSKMLMQSNDDESTSPPRCSRYKESKMSRKKSLKRLCF